MTAPVHPWSPDPEGPWFVEGGVLDVRPLLRPEQDELRALLSDLDDDGWRAPTAAPGWDVHAVVSHLLGDHLGRLSRHRDGWSRVGPADGEPLPRFIDRSNAEWVTAARRLSPSVLVALLGEAAEAVATFWEGVDLGAHGGPVTWASPDPAPVWLDAARDYTESWVHQQQVREAVGATLLDAPVFLRPVVHTFAFALPAAMAAAAPASRATGGTSVGLVVPGEAGGTFHAALEAGAWRLRRGLPSRPDAVVTLEADLLWRLGTRGTDPAQAAGRAHVDGDETLAGAALTLLAIIR